MMFTRKELHTQRENDCVFSSYKVSNFLAILLIICSGNKIRLLYILLAANIFSMP